MFSWKNFISSDEKIIFEEAQSLDYRNFFVRLWVILISLVCIPFALAVTKDFALTFLLFFVCYVVVSSFIWISGIYYRSVRFCLTDKGIYKVAGFINLDVVFVPYKKITDTKLELGIFERMFKIGSVLINTAGGNDNKSSGPMIVYKNLAFNLSKSASAYEMEVTHIKNYSTFMEIISKNI